MATGSTAPTARVCVPVCLLEPVKFIKKPARQNAASPSQTFSFRAGLRAGSVSLLRSVVKSYSGAALPLFAASILIDALGVGLTRLNIYPLFLSRRQTRVELRLFFPLQEERGKCLDVCFSRLKTLKLVFSLIN